MQLPSHSYAPGRSPGLATAVIAAALVLYVPCALAQARPPSATGSILALSQTLPTLAGVPTLLTVAGFGDCKFRLTYLQQDAPAAPQAQWTYSSTAQNPFPMRLKMFDATPPGTYTWSVTGIEGCMGQQRVTFTVR